MPSWERHDCIFSGFRFTHSLLGLSFPSSPSRFCTAASSTKSSSRTGRSCRPWQTLQQRHQQQQPIMNWKQTTAIPARLNNLKSNFIIEIFLDHTIYFYLKLKIHFNDSKLPRSILIHLKSNLITIFRTRSPKNIDSEKIRAIIDRERHLVKVVAIVMSALLICWTPFWIVNLVK